MRTKQKIALRRSIHAHLAEQDAANRCVICRRNLNEVECIVEDFCVKGKCCSDGCLDELLERNR